MTPGHPKPREDKLFQASALAMAKIVVSSWTWLYTLAAPQTERKARREEVLSDLHDQVAQEREEGTAPIKTTLHISARVILGMWDDVKWAGRQVASTLDAGLRRGSDVVGSVRPSPRSISSLAMLGLMNCILATSRPAHSWYEWLAVNTAALTVALLLLGRRLPTVRGPSLAWSTLAAVLVIGPVTWMVLGVRLEQVPAAPQLGFDAFFAVLLIVSGTLAAARTCQVRVSWAEWWPVWLCWATVGVVAWGTAVSAGGGLLGLAELFLVTALVCISWMALASTLTFASRAACYGGLMGSARCMRWLAVRIRVEE